MTKLALLLSVGLAVMVIGCEEEEGGTAATGTSGSGGTGTTSAGGAGGEGGSTATSTAESSSTGVEPSGCAAYPVPDNFCLQPYNWCQIAHCEIQPDGFGYCANTNVSPTNHCGGGRCFGGACCFTCLVDSGAADGKVGEVDKTDGPCYPGNQDENCGFGGVVCMNCKALGKVCQAGACVVNP